VRRSLRVKPILCCAVSAHARQRPRMACFLCTHGYPRPCRNHLPPPFRYPLVVCRRHGATRERRGVAGIVRRVAGDPAACRAHLANWTWMGLWTASSAALLRARRARLPFYCTLPPGAHTCGAAPRGCCAACRYALLGCICHALPTHCLLLPLPSSHYCSAHTAACRC